MADDVIRDQDDREEGQVSAGSGSEQECGNCSDPLPADEEKIRYLKAALESVRDALKGDWSKDPGIREVQEDIARAYVPKLLKQTFVATALKASFDYVRDRLWPGD